MERMYGGGGDGGGGVGGVVMTRDSKPRLRWTVDLHDRFVDAVSKLGGPDSESILLALSLVLQSTQLLVQVTFYVNYFLRIM